MSCNESWRRSPIRRCPQLDRSTITLLLINSAAEMKTRRGSLAYCKAMRKAASNSASARSTGRPHGETIGRWPTRHGGGGALSRTMTLFRVFPCVMFRALNAPENLIWMSLLDLGSVAKIILLTSSYAKIDANIMTELVCEYRCQTLQVPSVCVEKRSLND